MPRPSIYTDTDVYEILTRLAAMLPQGGRYLGIGVQEGACVRHVVQANTAIDLWLCDTWGREHGGTGRGSSAHIDALLNAEGATGRRTFLNGPSQVLVPQLPGNLTFDLIYVDGNHEEAAAYDDLVHCWPRCRGAMVVHDVHMPPVWAAFTRFASAQVAVLHVQYSAAGTGTVVVFRLGGVYAR